MPVIDLPSHVYEWTPESIESVLVLAAPYGMTVITQVSLDCFVQSGQLKSDLVERFTALVQTATDTRPSTTASAAAAAAAAAAAMPATDIPPSSGRGDAPAAAAASPPSGHIKVRLISVYVHRNGKKGLHVGVLVEFAGVTADGKTARRCWIVDRTHAQFGLEGDKFPTAGTKEHRRWAAALANPDSKPKVLRGDDRDAALTAWRRFLQGRYGVSGVGLEGVGETLSSVGAS